MRTFIAIAALVTMVGCSKKPGAADVCKQIEASGVGANCRTSPPNGLSAGAAEKYEFDLPSVAGKTGQVLRFDSEEKFAATSDAFEKAAVLAGPHRYGSKKALVFVQANNGLSADDGAKIKGVVEAL
jgi:hypothetical protein